MTSVRQEIEHYVVAQPEYADVLSVYGAVRQLQTEVMSRSKAPVPQPVPQIARQRLLAGQHILTGEHVTIEEALFQSLAVNLLELLPVEWSLRYDVERLLNSDAWNNQTAGHLAECFALNWRSCLDELAVKSGVDVAATSYVLQTTLGPFFERAAISLRDHLTSHIWNRGSCPICGNPPIMAKLTLSGGQRRLGCGLCTTEWSFPRATCPFCGESNPHHLRQFHARDDLGHRVDVCATCETYIKTADERELKRVVVLTVEDLVTVHLDLLARDQGYQ